MKPEELEVGALYELARDVKNPVKDKRSSNLLLKREVFQKGMLFVCLTDDEFPSLRRLHITQGTLLGYPAYDCFTAAVIKDGVVGLSERAENREWTKAIVPYLEEIPVNSWERLRTAYGRHGMPAVLKALVEDGTVPLGRVARLMRENTPGAKLS